MSESEARNYALTWVRRMADKGYDSACAKKEIFMGQSGPGEPGYIIRCGKITVPMSSGPSFTFRFEELEKMIEQPQQMALNL